MKGKISEYKNTLSLYTFLLKTKNNNKYFVFINKKNYIRNKKQFKILFFSNCLRRIFFFLIKVIIFLYFLAKIN